MTWLLFMDESGHDHRTMPYEVRGGVALHVGKLWDFVQEVKKAEAHCFGASRNNPKFEIKGSKFLNRARVQLGEKSSGFSDDERQRLCGQFLRGRESSTLEERQAYAKACLEMVESIFSLLEKYDARIFASLIPSGVKKPDGDKSKDFLRKDYVFLLERYFYFLEREREHGVLVMDETEKMLDRSFVASCEKYFTRTHTGRERTSWIVPIPFFVASDMSYPVQVADLCIYCINWGYRTRRIDAPSRPEIAEKYGMRLRGLEEKGSNVGSRGDFSHRSIVYVPDPYEART